VKFHQSTGANQVITAGEVKELINVGLKSFFNIFFVIECEKSQSGAKESDVLKNCLFTLGCVKVGCCLRLKIHLNIFL
jgi:hypothetical protein